MIPSFSIKARRPVYPLSQRLSARGRGGMAIPRPAAYRKDAKRAAVQDYSHTAAPESSRVRTQTSLTYTIFAATRGC